MLQVTRDQPTKKPNGTELDQEIVEKFTALTERNKALIVETLIESLFEQAKVAFDHQKEIATNL